MSLAGPLRELRELPIALVDAPEMPSRSGMDEDLLGELADSIRVVGLINPISVVEAHGRYQVVAGHRRRVATELAGRATITCIVYASSADALDAIQFAENRHREELSPSDEAIWFSQLLEGKAGGDVDRLCGIVGEKRQYVEGRLALLSGDERVFQALERGDIRIGVAQQLNRCGDTLHRRMLLHQAITGGATVAVVSGWISEWVHVHQPASPQPTDQASASAPGPVLETNYFTCVLCEKSDAVHLMQPKNMHTYCYQAMFADMLEMWRRKHEFLRAPRTLDEAVELVNDLVDRFPQLAAADDPRRV